MLVVTNGLLNRHISDRMRQAQTQTNFDVEENEREQYQAKKVEVPVHEVCLKVLEVYPREVVPTTDYREMETLALHIEQKVVFYRTMSRLKHCRLFFASELCHAVVVKKKL